MLLSVLLRLLLRLLPLLALLCAVIPAVGGYPAAQDEAWQRFGFTACDLPCFAGITPGRTPFDTVSTLLVRHVPAVDPRMIAGGMSINFYARAQGQQFGGVARYDQGRVGELRLNISVPVAPLIDQLGAPACVLSSADAEARIVIFWKQGAITAAAVLGSAQAALDLRGNVLALWLSAGGPDPCALRGAVPWRGFAPLWAYRQ